MKTKKTTKSTNFPDFIFRTCSKTFHAYWHEMRRHEAELRRIYGSDRHHICIPEETGSVNQVHPKARLIVTFYRCALCLRDLTEQEAKKLLKKKKS